MQLTSALITNWEWVCKSTVKAPLCVVVKVVLQWTLERKKTLITSRRRCYLFSHSFITSGAYLYFRVARPSKNNSQCGVRCHNDQIMNTIWQSNKVCMQDRRNCYKMDIDWPSLSQQGITRWRVSKWLWSDACPITWSPITCPALFLLWWAGPPS